jgi:hypothetical protein
MSKQGLEQTKKQVKIIMDVCSAPKDCILSWNYGQGTSYRLNQRREPSMQGWKGNLMGWEYSRVLFMIQGVR